MAILMKGIRGKPVQLIQEILGIDADGIFGGGTEKALKGYQEDNGLAADGIAGPDTFASMGLHDLIRLGKGSKGEIVKKLQAALSIDADGKFGSGTEAAVRAFQETSGLSIDGIVGPKTIASLDLFGLVSASPETAATDGSVTDAEAQAAREDAWESIEEATSGALDKMKSMLPWAK